MARAGHLPEEATGFHPGWAIEASQEWLHSQQFSQLGAPVHCHHVHSTSGGCTPRATRAMARGSAQKIAEEAQKIAEEE